MEGVSTTVYTTTQLNNISFAANIGKCLGMSFIGEGGHLHAGLKNFLKNCQLNIPPPILSHPVSENLDNMIFYICNKS